MRERRKGPFIILFDGILNNCDFFFAASTDCNLFPPEIYSLCHIDTNDGGEEEEEEKVGIE